MRPAEPADDKAPALAYGAAFAETLLDPARPAPALVAGPRRKGAVKRYDVYRNNVTVSLIEALATIFPAVRRIAGEDFFRAMARAHVRATPPRSPLLFEYGRDFADFIAAYDYAAEVPWLADVARIERAWLDAYHAADAAPLAPEALARVPPAALGDLVFAAHPAARLTVSPYPAVSIFAAHRERDTDEPITATDGEDALITRPDLDVMVRRLPPGGAVFATALIAGVPLGAAAERALAAEAQFDLSANLAGLIEAGAFTGISLP